MNAKNIVNLNENNISTIQIHTSEYFASNTPTTKPNNIIYQVLEPGTSFTGRVQQIQDIHDNLQKKNIFVVTGLGGVGKTELLRTYAKKYKSSYENVIWINCISKIDFKNSFLGLAIELGIKVAKFKTERKLDIIVSDIYKSLDDEKTLIIFDNAISSKEVNLYMPRLQECKTFYCLLSSQNAEWGSIGTMSLKVLTLPEARNLIINNLPKGSYDNAEEIEELMRTLQFFPLAMQQAIAYITDKRNYVSNFYKISNYLEEYSKEELLLNHKFPGGLVFPDYSNEKYDKTIFINIQLMLNKIREISDNDDAENIIFISSFFAPDFINKNIFYPLIDKTNTENGLRILSKYSSINIICDWIFIHCLVQKVIRFILKNDDYLEYEIMMKAMSLAAQDLLAFATHFCSILRYIEKNPKVYLDFYNNNVVIEKEIFLYFIAHNNFFAILKTILNTDVNYDIENDELCFHIVFSDNIEMMIFVYTKGADVNKKVEFGTSPLHAAVFRNSFDMVDCLVRLGADIHTSNVIQFTPIYIAIICNNTKMIEHLVQKGHNLNIKSTSSNTNWEEIPLEMKTETFKKLLSFEWTPLVYAASTSELKTIQLLVNLGADVNLRINPFISASIVALDRSDIEIFKYLWTLQDKNDTFPDISLHNACKSGNVDAIKFLLENKFDVNTKNFNDDTPLMVALQQQDMEIVKLLVDNGADVNTSNLSGEFPLLIALSFKNYDLIKYLFTTGCDINQQRFDGLTSLDIAILEENEEIIKLLLENGATINQSNKDALFYAVLKGNLAILQHLNEYKANFGKCYFKSKNEMYSILHFSSEFGHLDVFKYLCNFVPIKNKTTLGNSVLHIASNFGHPDIVEKILATEDLIDDQNNELETPLHLAVTNGHFNITKYLIEKGSDINKKNKYSDTPILIAAKKNQLNILKFLLQNKAVLNVVNLNKDTALHLAVAENHLDIVKYLLKNNFEVDVMNKDGQASIHLASFYGYNEILLVLYEYGANINIQNSNGNTPIHLAVMGEHLNIVSFLIDKGARLNIKNKNDFQPIQLARKRKLNAIADIR